MDELHQLIAALGQINRYSPDTQDQINRYSPDTQDQINRYSPYSG